MDGLTERQICFEALPVVWTHCGAVESLWFAVLPSLTRQGVAPPATCAGVSVHSDCTITAVAHSCVSAGFSSLAADLAIGSF